MNAKQEILGILKYMEQCGEGDYDDIRAILETHELVPTRPFDPTQCGFTLIQSTIHRMNGFQAWGKDKVTLTRFDNGSGELEHSCGRILFPWPATQSDGEALLRLLGVPG